MFEKAEARPIDQIIAVSRAGDRAFKIMHQRA